MSFKALKPKQKQQPESDPSYKLVLVGDSGVGKSCLLEKLLDISSKNTFISTIGVDVKSHNVSLNGNSYKLQVWDTGGQQRYRPVLASCYRNAHGVIVVYDVTNAKSFANLAQWIKEITEFLPSSTPGGVDTTPKLLIGNKCDLESRREVERETAEKFAKENGLEYIECSAVAVVNIREAFITLINKKVQQTSPS